MVPASCAHYLAGLYQWIEERCLLRIDGKSHPLCVYWSVILLSANSGEEGGALIGLGSMLMKVKWTPILVLILVEAGKATKAVVGTSTLTVGNQNFEEFSFQMDVDLGHLENSISRLDS